MVVKMFIGFLTGGQLGDLKKSLKWAEDHGFKSISISTSPESSFFKVREILSSPQQVRDVIKSTTAIISAIGFYGNPIHPDEAIRKSHQEFFMSLIEAAHRIEVPVVTGWVGLYPGTDEENVKLIERVWPSIVKSAEDRGIKIAIENCSGNIAYRPDVWRKMFEVIPSKNFGLEFDPSHLICQLIDPVWAADEFGERIHHTHMKDAQVLRDKVSKFGVRSQGWCPHRLPGFGDAKWEDLITVLKKHGYKYALSIEHEDPYFEYEQGLLLAKKFLERFVA